MNRPIAGIGRLFADMNAFAIWTNMALLAKYGNVIRVNNFFADDYGIKFEGFEE